MKKTLILLKDFIIHLFKTSWFKIIVFALICFTIMTIMDLSNIHYDEYNRLELQLKAGEITYEQADYMMRALYEQIMYQVAIAVIISVVFIAGAVIEHTSKLHERVKRIDFRLWKLDRNVEEMYDLQRLKYDDVVEAHTWDDEDVIRPSIDITDKAAIQRELGRLQEEHVKRVANLKELERKFNLMREHNRYKDED